MEAVPLEGSLPVAMEKTEPSVRPSASVAERVAVMLESSASEPELPEETTAESTAVTVRLMACVVVPPKSSVMVTVKESVPLKLALGA